MSYIPDTFSKMQIDLRTGKPKDERNPYWYKILEGADADFVRGFDFAQEQFELMLENVMDSLFEIFAENPADFIESTDEEKEDEIKELFNGYLYGDRNELVVSMIESMDQQDYDRRFEEVKDLPEDQED